MHRSETREFESCADCGAEVTPGRERAYAFGPGSFLCFECALRRGGSYDETHDRWTVEADTAGLPVSEN
jgi:recombinational DNA repair protein (RecF pathway)